MLTVATLVLAFAPAPQGYIVVRPPPQRAAVGAQAQPGAPRAWIGLELGDDDRPGIAVKAVTRGSPAARARLRPGDRLLALDGRATDDYPQLAAALAQLAPGTQVTLRIRRELELRLDEKLKADDGRPALGVTLAGTPAASELRVEGVRPGSPAARAGVAPRDLLVSLDGVALTQHRDLVEHMRAAGAPGRVKLGLERTLELTLAAAPKEVAQAPAPGPTARPTPAEPQPGLRALAAELKALRAELAQLRDELRSLRAQLNR